MVLKQHFVITAPKTDVVEFGSEKYEPKDRSSRSWLNHVVKTSEVSIVPDQNNLERVQKLISRSSSIVGSATGGALGYFAAGPVGAGAGALAGTLISQMIEIGGDLCCRHLSPREEMRVGATFALAAIRIQERLDSGEAPRDDGFFEEGTTDRSAAEELFEGVLLKSRLEHEEKKIGYLGNIFATTAFSDISPSDANAVLDLAQRLSMRQICILSAVGRQKDFPDAERFKLDRERDQWNRLPLLQYELEQLVEVWQTIHGGFPRTQHKPGLTNLGSQCFRLMGLAAVPVTDILPVIAQAPTPSPRRGLAGLLDDSPTEGDGMAAVEAR